MSLSIMISRYYLGCHTIQQIIIGGIFGIIFGILGYLLYHYIFNVKEIEKEINKIIDLNKEYK